MVLTIERPLEVRRVAGLPQEYEHDAALLEGKHPNLPALKTRVRDYDIFFGYPAREVIDPAYKLLEEKIREGRLHTGHKVNDIRSLDKVLQLYVRDGYLPVELAIPLGHSFCPEELARAMLFLDGEKIPSLRHRIEVRPDGLYFSGNAPIAFMEFPLEEPLEIKIADIIKYTAPSA